MAERQIHRVITTPQGTYKPGDEERLAPVLTRSMGAHLVALGAITCVWTPGIVPADELPAPGERVLVLDGEVYSLRGMDAERMAELFARGAQLGEHAPEAEPAADSAPSAPLPSGGEAPEADAAAVVAPDAPIAPVAEAPPAPPAPEPQTGEGAATVTARLKALTVAQLEELAKARGMDLAKVTGSGAGGAVVKADLVLALAADIRERGE
jgi:hypothetical protein